MDHVEGYLGVSQNKGYLFGGSYNKDYSILGSILGYPNLRNYHLRCVGDRVLGFRAGGLGFRI